MLYINIKFSGFIEFILQCLRGWLCSEEIYADIFKVI